MNYPTQNKNDLFSSSGRPFVRTNGSENKDSVLDMSIQEENEEHIGMLADRISAIKRISQGIKEHVTKEKDLLSDMTSGFTKSNGLMASTMRKLDEAFQSKGGSVIIYTLIFVILILLLLYKLS